MRLARRTLLGAALALSAGAAAQTAPPAAPTGPVNDTEASGDEIVVTGYGDIVVNGRAIRCRPAARDPLDNVDVSSHAVDPHTGMLRYEHLAVVPDGSAGYLAVPNNEQVTGPEYWQRVGVRLDQYVFRGPSADKPMCVGRRRGIDGFAGFRRIVDAAPYRGHRLRFTAWVATGRAQQVNFWLAAGTEWSAPAASAKPVASREDPEKAPPYTLLNGGNTNSVPFGGSHGWTPVLIETGPIHGDAHHVSYGFNLQGSGDVWVYQPRLEILVDQPADLHAEDLLVVGLDRR